MVRDEPGSHEDLQEFVALTLKLIGKQQKFCLPSRVWNVREEMVHSFSLNGVEIGEMRRGLLETTLWECTVVLIFHASENQAEMRQFNSISDSWEGNDIGFGDGLDTREDYGLNASTGG